MPRRPLDRHCWLVLLALVLAGGCSRDRQPPPTGSQGPASLLSTYVERAAQARRQHASKVAEVKRAIADIERAAAGGAGPAPGNPRFSGGGARSVSVSKRCGRCSKGVSSSSKVGDRCPHCGVVWGAERRHGIPGVPGRR